MANTKKYLLIDGENLRKSVSSVLESKDDFLNLNIRKLLENSLGQIVFDKVIWYGAKLKQNKNDLDKSRKIIDFQRKMFNVLRKQNVNINLSGRIQCFGKNFKEKGVDVAIATDLVSFSFEIPNIEIYLFSNDSDLVPAIKKAVSKNIVVNYLTIEDLVTNSVKSSTSKTFIIKKDFLLKTFYSGNLETTNPSGTNQAGVGMK